MLCDYTLMLHHTTESESSGVVTPATTAVAVEVIAAVPSATTVAVEVIAAVTATTAVAVEAIAAVMTVPLQQEGQLLSDPLGCHTLTAPHTIGEPVHLRMCVCVFENVDALRKARVRRRGRRGHVKGGKVKTPVSWSG
jgi:urea transporter